jgi:phosphoglycerate dehydrogenase-like enzyme
LYDALHTVAGSAEALLHRFGVGHDGVDKRLARNNGVLVCNTPGALDESVAEHVFWLMGCLARRVARSEHDFRNGNFRGETGRELSGKRLGVLGFGRIGRRVAAMARFGFGMTVWAAASADVEKLERSEKRPLAEIQKMYGLEFYTNDASRLLRECDYVSLHLPANSNTRHFIGASRLAQMKPSGALINTARGWVVDEAALFDVLAAGQIAGAALDVFEHEPYRPVDPAKDLRTLPNVVLTPHIGSNTVEANTRMAEMCLANLHHFFQGRFDRLTRVDIPQP